MPLRVGIPYQPYKFLVEALDGRFVAQDDRGRIRYSGKDAATVIQKALGGLTTGRTWKETVKLKGQFTIDTPIKIPSYTTLDLEGAYLKLADLFAYNEGLLRNEDFSAGNSYIDIIGGVIDGNKDNQTGSEKSPHGIEFQAVTDSNIIRVTLHNFPYGEYTAAFSRAINLAANYSMRNLISECILYNNSYADIFIGASCHQKSSHR